METYKEADAEHPFLKMPDVEEQHSAGYIVALLQEAGLMSTNGMGPVPLSWLEIESWLNVTGTEVGLYEKLMIRSMSEEYVAERNAATEKFRPAPYTHAPEEEEIDREKVSNKLYSFLSRRTKQGREAELATPIKE